MTIDEITSVYAKRVYATNKFNATATAKALGISYNTLCRYLGKNKKS